MNESQGRQGQSGGGNLACCCLLNDIDGEEAGTIDLNKGLMIENWLAIHSH